MELKSHMIDLRQCNNILNCIYNIHLLNCIYIAIKELPKDAKDILTTMYLRY